jgi:hypothetical protein
MNQKNLIYYYAFIYYYIMSWEGQSNMQQNLEWKLMLEEKNFPLCG